MGVQVVWDNPEKTIILMTVAGHWEWEAFKAVVNLCNEMIESVPYHVHFILDRQGGHWTPGNFSEHTGDIISMFTPNDGYRVIVGENPLTKERFYNYGTLNGGTGFKFRYMNSVEDARAFLGGQPVTLKSNNPPPTT
ncbi:MAG: hypothetical protein ABI690_30205 [Chloroflexota bacterium]